MSATRNIAHSVLALCAFGISHGITAEPLHYNIVNLSAAAQHTVANDLLRGTLYAEDSHAQPAQLAQRLTRTLNDALTIAKNYPEVTVSTGGQHTWPLYDTARKLNGWRGRVSLNIESRSPEQASALIAAVQGRLHVESLHFEVSSQARKNADNVLLPNALAAFHERAQRIAQQLGNGRYRSVQMTVEHSGGHTPQPYNMMRSAKLNPAPDSTEFAAGETELALHIQGSIQLEGTP